MGKDPGRTEKAPVEPARGRSRWRPGWAAALAWRFGAALLVATVAIKAVWIGWALVDGTVRYGPLDWAVLAPLATHQSLLAALVVSAVYFGLLLLGSPSRPTRVAAVVLVVVVQGTLTFFHMVALRMAMLIGSFPTFGFIRLATQGQVVGSSLLAPENVGYTVVGAMLVLATCLLPLLLWRRAAAWTRRRRLGWAAGLALWSGAGLAADLAIARDLSQTAIDPAVFFLGEMIGEQAERAGIQISLPPGSFRQELLFGDPTPERTALLVRNRAAWDRTNRNVVLIVLESTPARHASFAGPVVVDGEERDTTPVLRSLRESTLVAENHYAVHPTSMADLFSLACSMYPYPMRPNITDINPEIPCTSMSELLAANGYEAALFHSGHFSFYRKDLFFRNRGFSTMHDERTMPGRAGAFSYRWGVDERVTVRAISDFIRSNRHRPFFVQYIPVFPHAPYRTPPDVVGPFPDTTDLDRFHNTVHYVDAAVGTVVETLRELDLLDDTLLIVVGDHGEAFLEHPGNRVHSLFIYDENVHVAFGMHNPLLFSGAPSIHRVTSHIDILPTVADLLELPRGPAWQGHSMVEDGPSRLAYFYALSGRQLVGLRDGRFKVIWDRESGAVEVYDIERDPEERRDLSPTLRDRLARYRRALSEWRSYHIALIPRFGRREEGRAEGIRWVADLEPVRSFQPHVHDPVPDHAVSGRSLEIDGVRYGRGLGVHAPSSYTYDLSGLGAARLVGRVGRDSRPSRGRAEAFVFLDGRLAFSSGSLGPGVPAVAFDLDVSEVREASLVTWEGTDSARGDHVSWAEVRLLTDGADLYEPGLEVSLEAEVAVGANTAGRRTRPISGLRQQRVTNDDGRFDQGLVVPPGASVSYDLRHLGATRLLGRLSRDGAGGAPPPWVELSLDRRRVFREEPPAAPGPLEMDLPIPEGGGLLTIRAGSSELAGGGDAVLADLRVTTSADRFARNRRGPGRDLPRDWPLALAPLGPPLPQSGAVGWSLDPRGGMLTADGTDEPESLWVAAGAELAYDLAGFGPRRLTGRAAAAGPGRCSVRATLRAGERRPWQGPELRPDGASVPFEVDLEGAERLRVATEGDRGCALVLLRPRLVRSP